MIELEDSIVRAERSSAMRMVLDPDDLLPVVSLSKEPEGGPADEDPRLTHNSGRERRYLVTGHVAGPVGEIAAGSLRIGNRPDADIYAITDMDVEPGFETAARLLAMEATRAAAIPFGTDILTPREEYLLWARLIEARLAYIVMGFEGAQPGIAFDEQRYYTGDARLGLAP